jgi:hypothetical protein
VTPSIRSLVVVVVVVVVVASSASSSIVVHLQKSRFSSLVKTKKTHRKLDAIGTVFAVNNAGKPTNIRSLGSVGLALFNAIGARRVDRRVLDALERHNGTVTLVTTKFCG